MEDTINVREPTQRSTQNCSDEDGDERTVEGENDQPGNEVSVLNPGILEAQNKFELLFKSQYIKKSIAMAELPAKRCLIMYDESGPKIVKVKESLWPESSNEEIDVTGLQQVSAHSK